MNRYANAICDTFMISAFTIGERLSPVERQAVESMACSTYAGSDSISMQ